MSKSTSAPTCNKCGEKIPVGLDLHRICIKCLTKPTYKNI